MQSRRARTVLAFLAAVAVPPAARLAAQQSGSPPAVVTDSAAGALARVAAIDKRYDRALDRTTLRASVPDVAAGLDFSVSAVYTGGLLRTTPDRVYVSLTHTGPRRRLRRGDVLDLIVDGKYYLLRDGLSVSSRKVRGLYVEQVAVPISLADFAAVANALAVGGKYGAVSFWLAGEPLDVLRDFATRVLPRPRVVP
jgi:hypothetical protein